MSDDDVSFERATSVRALWEGARRAARGKRDRSGVARAMLDREGLVLGLHRALRDGSWWPGLPARFEVRDPKARTIAAAPFADRVVHQALCAEIGPRLERGLIGDSYACRVGKGTHAALARAERWLRAHRFALHLDVRKYFLAIDHELLLAQLARDLRCPRTLALCERIVREGARHLEPARFHFAGDDLFAPLARGVGLPIGSLTSQHFANRYLSPVDHRAKDRLRVRAYLRTMDDLLLFDDDRARLTDLGHALEEACHRQRLRLHPWQVVPARAGVRWLGFRILPGETRVVRSSVVRAKARLARLVAAAREEPARWPEVTASLRATFAHWAHGDTWRLRTATLRELGLHVDAPPPEPREAEPSDARWGEADLDALDRADEVGEGEP